ncbi:FkbM family methyltransferase [Ferrovibrio sp.]|uniref:FkbM family methyltransferase n=1 Tax=Ferrovibrio sp. TaxID=1917215 RepID=UPI00260CF90E|nr:FkbM family methyltransferase [Ferrovibrio sp.]
MRWNPRTFVDRLLWIRSYPAYREAPLRFAARAMTFTWREQASAAGDVTFTACNGQRFLSPPNNISSFIAATFGERDLNITRFWKHALPPEPVIFDIGANIGLYTLSAVRHASHAGRVIGFEAHPATFRYLQHNATYLSDPRIVIENLAVGAESGKARIAFNAANPGETHIATGEEHGILVPMVTLDDYCRQHGIPRIDYMKIDVEGYEANVLRGAADIIAASPNILIQTEYEPQHMRRYGDTAMVQRLLEGWGLQPHVIGWQAGQAFTLPTLADFRGEIIWSRRPLC